MDEKCKLAKYPQNKYWFRLFDNVQHHKTTAEVLKANPGACGAINLWYFSLANQPSAGVKYWDHQAAVMICGTWACKPTYAWPGLCIDADGKATVGYDKDATYDYAASVQADYIDGKRTNTTAWGRNGVTYTGFTADGVLVAMVCSKDHGMTSAEAVKAMRDAGCVTILRWDGSWSSQGQLLPGVTVKPSQNRPVRGWLIIYPRAGQNEEGKPVGKKKVCLDAGHGVETAGKCAPDKSYYEHEFNLDMTKRQKGILERHGVEVFLTRTDEHDISLERRVQIANAIKDLDLFVSDHSNASGDGLSWTNPDGYGIYTSAAGATANRNIAAGKLIARAKAAGIKLWDDGLFHSALYVCKNAVAPAILIEHGFHTNKAETAKLKTAAYRQQLAEVDCKGILDYLGVEWRDEPSNEPKPPTNKHWYDADQAWVKENGISDGTKPEANITRAEVWAMLHRMANVK